MQHTDIAAAARAGAEQYFDAELEFLKKCSAIDCGTGNVVGNAKVTALISEILQEMGAEVNLIFAEGLGNHIVATLRPEGWKGSIVLNAHTDTVFGEGFTAQHPFHIEGDYAYGLGIGDCKAGIAISLYAVKAAMEAGLLPKKEIKFIYNCDEEIGTQSGSQVYAQEAKGAEYAFVFEGCDLRDGVYGVVTSRRGVILGTIDVTGKEAHAGAAYLEGRSAILEMAHKIIELYSFNDMQQGIYYNVAPVEGGRPNGIVAGSAHAEFCCAGLPTNASFSQAEQNICSLEEKTTVPDCRVTVGYRTLFPAMEKSAQNHLAYLAVEKAAHLLEIRVAEVAEAVATDAAYLSSLGIPTADALSAVWKDIHTTEECIYLPSLKEKTALFIATLAML